MQMNQTKQPYIETKASLNFFSGKFGYSRKFAPFRPVGRTFNKRFSTLNLQQILVTLHGLGQQVSFYIVNISQTVILTVLKTCHTKSLPITTT